MDLHAFARCTTVLLLLLHGSVSQNTKVVQNYLPASRFLAHLTSTPAAIATAISRSGCSNQGRANTSRALSKLREAMRQPTLLQDNPFDAFIVVSTDAHQNEEPAAEDRRLLYATGWFGSGRGAITKHGEVALWTSTSNVEQAKLIVACDIEVFDAYDPVNTIGYWLTTKLPKGSRVGADDRLIEAAVWQELAYQLFNVNGFKLIPNEHWLDKVWNSDGRPAPSPYVAMLDPEHRAGMHWLEKVAQLRAELRSLDVDAMIVTALDEIAWLLNIRGKDLPYSPLIKSFLIVTQTELDLFIPKGKFSPIEVREQFNSDRCYNQNCTTLSEYDSFYLQLATKCQAWKSVLIPLPGVYHRGASQRVVFTVPESKRYLQVSPIIPMKALKNKKEREQMRIAQVKDAAALMQVLEMVERMIYNANKWTELDLIDKIDRTRDSQATSKGLSRRTIVAFGPNGAIPDYQAHNKTTNIISANSTVVIESGGHYESGTAVVTRTVHYGRPTSEERKAYTIVLQAAIEMSSLVFPAEAKASNLDAMARAPIWKANYDYPHSTGHGVGSLLNYREDPIDVHYDHLMSLEQLRDGYFLTNEPGYYKPGKFGVKLGNILEVVVADVKSKNETSSFLRFEDVTLVPYEPKLIETDMLTIYQRKWLNNYNRRIRMTVGAELNKLGYKHALTWMLLRTPQYDETPFSIAVKLSPASLLMALIAVLCVFVG